MEKRRINQLMTQNDLLELATRIASCEDFDNGYFRCLKEDGSPSVLSTEDVRGLVAILAENIERRNYCINRMTEVLAEEGKSFVHYAVYADTTWGNPQFNVTLHTMDEKSEDALWHQASMLARQHTEHLAGMIVNSTVNMIANKLGVENSPEKVLAQVLYLLSQVPQVGAPQTPIPTNFPAALASCKQGAKMWRRCWRGMNKLAVKVVHPHGFLYPVMVVSDEYGTTLWTPPPEDVFATDWESDTQENPVIFEGTWEWAIQQMAAGKEVADTRHRDQVLRQGLYRDGDKMIPCVLVFKQNPDPDPEKPRQTVTIHQHNQNDLWREYVLV